MADSPWTEDQLRAHLQHAIELELFTIPAYLCAYSRSNRPPRPRLSLVETPYQASDRSAPTSPTRTPRFRYTPATPQQTYVELDATWREAAAVQAAASALQLVFV